jgi:hypothetical protein
MSINIYAILFKLYLNNNHLELVLSNNQLLSHTI